MKYSIRTIQLHEFNGNFQRIEQDFVPGEYAPYDILYQHLQTGTQKGLILLEDECEVAYCICAEGSANDYVLISLFAVYREYRGRGLGSIFLQELKKVYSEKKGIIVEVEKPENAKTDKEKAIREKRIQFYQKAGFNLIPNIDYSIWDISMHLMALPQKASTQIINEQIEQIMYAIYFTLIGERCFYRKKSSESYRTCLSMN
ncbi:GNAT family N-acetyltransferase [Petroclostridium sp. X23]|uniref:GNAT family N-acetyltransferase n=1 Tax=Petroclostridium sp. X23 TaxID=3045146 RepID=UPI0024AE02AD|nr:GNAT family N-acetyltransferase [Petroclostridium sp. X23]WHH59851.1 GNAT family N-acetyltransferase [Petroclostridium sp. X23]